MQERGVHLGVFISIILLAGVVSVYFGKELSWDLANYHFYTPYALLQHRQQYDYWPPSFIHQYLNPAIDLLTYFLITHLSPIMAQFSLGAIHGINGALLVLIARQFTQNNMVAILLAVLGLYGPTALPGIGSFQNDNLISGFVLAAVYFQLVSQFLLAGVLVGVAVGLKPTAVVFAGGMLLAHLVSPPAPHTRKSAIFVSLAGLVIGFGMSGGYWLLHLRQQGVMFYSNQIHMSMIDRFLPKTIWQTLFYPFFFSWDGRTGDMRFMDFRFLFVYVLLVGIALDTYLRKRSVEVRTYWLYAFFIFSYAIWQFNFSIARYLVTLEMLAPLILYLAVDHLILNQHTKKIILAMLFYTLVFFMRPAEMIRERWYEHSFFNVHLPAVTRHVKQALVLMSFPAYTIDLDPRPQSYLIPFFPTEWRFIGIPFLHKQYVLGKDIADHIQKRIQSFSGPLFLLAPSRDMPEMLRAAHLFKLQAQGECTYIESDRQRLTPYPVLLCPVAMVR